MRLQPHLRQSPEIPPQFVAHLQYIPRLASTAGHISQLLVREFESDLTESDAVKSQEWTACKLSPATPTKTKSSAELATKFTIS